MAAYAKSRDYADPSIIYPFTLTCILALPPPRGMSSPALGCQRLEGRRLGVDYTLLTVY